MNSLHLFSFSYNLSFTTNLLNMGIGEPRVILNDDKGGSVPVKVINKNDGTFQVEFTVTMTGIYTAIVMFANQPVPKNPFKITVQSGVDVSKVVVKGLPESEKVTASNELFTWSSNIMV